MNSVNKENILSLMKITDSSGNVIPWDYNLFPDGQVQLKIFRSLISSNESYSVKVSLPNTLILDLFDQFLADFDVPHVTVNYLYGARSDKKTAGDYYVSNVASNMLVKIIFNPGILKVNFLAPHCDDKISAKHATVNFDIPDCVDLKDYDLIVFPDKSAYRRYSSQIGGCAFTICEKERDQETGKIVSHKISKLPDHVKKVIVVDDLCDGGYTFISLARSLPDDVERHLFIFHGVFSNNGLEKVCDSYSKVFVSNSLPNYKESEELIPNFSDRVCVFDVWEGCTIDITS